MQVIEAVREAQALDPRGQLVYVLKPGLQYVMFDAEAFAGVRDGALRPVGPLDGFVPGYEGQSVSDQRVLVLFTGGQGDAVLLNTCLSALQRQYPQLRIGISTPRSNHGIFKLLGAGFEILHYPPRATELHHYAYHLSLEKLSLFAGDAETGTHDDSVTNLELFSRCLYTPPVEAVDVLDFPDDARRRWDIGQSAHPRVGIALTKAGFMRAYPSDLALRMAERLIEQQVAVLIFGRSNELDRQIPHAPPWLFNAVDKTPDLESLAAIISQLDGMICPDTLFMHLAGALRVPTLAIFTSSPAAVAGGYPTVQAATARVACSPCGAAGEECPQNHDACVVHRHEDLHPATLADRMLSMLPTGSTAPVLTG